MLCSVYSIIIILGFAKLVRKVLHLVVLTITIKRIVNQNHIVFLGSMPFFETDLLILSLYAAIIQYMVIWQLPPQRTTRYISTTTLPADKRGSQTQTLNLSSLYIRFYKYIFFIIARFISYDPQCMK